MIAPEGYTQEIYGTRERVLDEWCPECDAQIGECCTDDRGRRVRACRLRLVRWVKKAPEPPPGLTQRTIEDYLPST